MPPTSKKRMTTDCGSSAASRTDTPPEPPSMRIPKRVTGTVATSRSATSTPVALRPTIIARLRTRAARLVSRDATTVEPFFIVVPYAMARRTASSGEMSTLARPATPRRPNKLRAPRDSQTIDELTMAPCSTVLNG